MGDTKQVVLCDAEKAEILHLFPVEYPASCMHWMEVQDDSRWEFVYKEDPCYFSIDDLVSFMWLIIFLSSTLSSFSESEDESSRFLPKLPSLPKR